LLFDKLSVRTKPEKNIMIQQQWAQLSTQLTAQALQTEHPIGIVMFAKTFFLSVFLVSCFVRMNSATVSIILTEIIRQKSLHIEKDLI
jgi:hypothetical protein